MARYKAITPKTYISPLLVGIEFEFVAVGEVYPYTYIDNSNYCYYRQIVSYDGNDIWTNEFKWREFHGIVDGENIGYTVVLKSGIYNVYYECGTYEPSIGGGGFYHKISSATYTFYVTENTLSLKKWTITDVINRLLDLAEPIRKGEKPRFRLNGMRADGTIITPDDKKEGEEVGQAYQFDKILCPQLSFTKEHLRECLQEVGKVIHGEPRLIPKKDADGWYFEVSYDMYGSGRMSTISRHKPYQIVTQHALESFCSALDSSAENLINTLDKYSGVISEPFQDGYKTVRTENSYVRVTDRNMIIATQYPIYSIDKVEYNDNGTAVDITPYLFEASEYSRLSSYEKGYPKSKLYALRYTQGEQNIDGLNFKRTTINAAGDTTAFGDYSIVEILKAATSNEKLNIEEYPRMQFRVTYTPIYNTRVSQTKAYYKDVRKAAALFYNQQSNLVETRSYGENLKGAVARLGNIDKTISYMLFSVSSIPKAGDMFDEDYMISAVAVEFLPTYIKCTIALTKSFNRISQFIGVSSVKRYSEISETQALERNVLYREYIVIGDAETPDSDTRIWTFFIALVEQLFSPNNEYLQKPNCVIAWGESYKGTPTETVLLPLISSAFGNSVSFYWRYDDNYSAGDTVNYASVKDNNVGDITGYFQNTFNYTDNYGRIYYYNFSLARNVQQEDDYAMKLPLYTGSIPSERTFETISTIGQEPYILRKDNRETLSFNFQVDFVTNRKDIIIGSALASYCPAVRGVDKSLKPRLYVFPDRLDKFINHVESVKDYKLDDLPSIPISTQSSLSDFGFIILSDKSFPADGKSWAIVTNQYSELKEVEDEKGKVSEQQEVHGGDVIIACNIDVRAGDPFPLLYFTAKREIFDRSVWKDRR